MATLTDVVVPDIGDFDAVPITEIFVEVGQAIKAEDALVEMESDKATMEVPAPFGGTVAELLVAVGDKVSQGTLLLRMDTDGQGPSADEQDGQTAPAGAEAASPAAVEAAIVGEAQAQADTEGPAVDAPLPEPEPVHASPVARRMARHLGVELSGIDGTGHNGRITKDDVQRSASAPASPTSPETGAVESSAPEAARLPLTRIQRISAERLSDAWRTIPHVTHHEQADITELEAFRRQLNSEQKDTKVTMVALLLVACASALGTYPRFASSLEGDELVIKEERHIGFAADTPAGLVVPVVKDVASKGILQVADELTELSEQARAGSLSPRAMSGAVFTVSSLGGIGGTGFTPIVNPPQVAILGVSRSAHAPVWDGERFQPRLQLPLSLSYDHRVIDGAAAARFCAHLASLLGDFRRMLL